MPLVGFWLLGAATLGGALGFVGGRGVAGTGNIIKYTVIGAGLVIGARAMKVI